MTGLSILGEAECRRLLARESLGRVVVSIDALPAALPVNYRLHQDAILFRTGPGTKLNRALNNTIVGFEVDSFDTQACTGWSVLVIGTAALVNGGNAALEAIEIPSLAGHRFPHLIKIVIQQISGRRIGTITT